MKLLFATANRHKASEVAAILPRGVELLTLNDIHPGWNIEETGNTFQENALIKAQALWEREHLPVIADDSGLEVEALHNRPGVHSARFAGPDATDLDNCKKLIAELQSQGLESSPARFRTVICFFSEHGPQYFEGTLPGRVHIHMKGSNGFGYDPLFMPEGKNLTLAEMTADEKNSISHRSLALRAFLEHFPLTDIS